MKIGIIGAGAIGSTIARILSKAGIEVAIANSRGPESLQGLADELGPKVRPVSREQAAQSDIVFLAVNWSKIPDALENLPACLERTHRGRYQQPHRGADLSPLRSGRAEFE